MLPKQLSVATTQTDVSPQVVSPQVVSMAENNNIPKVPIGATFDRTYNKQTSKIFGRGNFAGSVVAFDAKSQKYRVKYHNGMEDELSWVEMREHLNLRNGASKAVHQINHSETICNNTSMRNEDDPMTSKCPKPVPVLQIDLETNKVVRTHLSMTSAAAEFGGAQSSSISKCCSGEHKSAYGFGWRRAEGTENAAKEVSGLVGVGTSFLKAFPGNGIFLGRVTNVDQGLYHVRYTDGDEEDLNKKELHDQLSFTLHQEKIRENLKHHATCKKTVHQIDLTTGESICTHASMTSAADNVGVDKSCIGKTATAGGFKWAHTDTMGTALLVRTMASSDQSASQQVGHSSLTMAENKNMPKVPIGTTFDRTYKQHTSKLFGKGNFAGSIVAFDAKSQKYRVNYHNIKYHNGMADELSWEEIREHLNLQNEACKGKGSAKEKCKKRKRDVAMDESECAICERWMYSIESLRILNVKQGEKIKAIVQSVIQKTCNERVVKELQELMMTKKTEMSCEDPTVDMSELHVVRKIRDGALHLLDTDLNMIALSFKLPLQFSNRDWLIADIKQVSPVLGELIPRHYFYHRKTLEVQWFLHYDEDATLDVVAMKPLRDDEDAGKSTTKDGQHTCKQCTANANNISYKKGHDVGCPRRGWCVAKKKVVNYVGPCRMCLAEANGVIYKKGHDAGCPRRGRVAKKKVLDYVGPCRMCLAKANGVMYKKGHETTCPKSAKYRPLRTPASTSPLMTQTSLRLPQALSDDNQELVRKLASEKQQPSLVKLDVNTPVRKCSCKQKTCSKCFQCSRSSCLVRPCICQKEKQCMATHS
jgi:hypothetical protein